MFLIFIFLAVWILIFALAPQNTVIKNKYTAYFTMILLFFYVTFILVTFENESVDMSRYLREFQDFTDFSLSYTLQTSTRETLFVLFQWVTAQISGNPAFFQFMIWLVISTLLFFSLRKVFTPWQLLIVIFCYLNYFVFFNYITNTIRQGFAISLIIMAITIMMSNRKQTFLFYISIIAAPFFHATTIPLSIALFIFKKFKINLKFLVFVWIVFVLLYLTGFNENIFGRFSDFIPTIDEYTTDSVLDRYDGGVNRLDFLMFSAFWLLYAYIAKKKFLIETDLKYNLLIKIYLTFNIFYLIFGFIGYSDRIAAYSWFLVPIMILYPLFKGRKLNHILLMLVIFAFIIVSILGGSLLYNQPFFY